MSGWSIYHHPQIFQGICVLVRTVSTQGSSPSAGAVGAFALSCWYRWQCGGGRRVPVFVFFFPSSENQRVGLIASPFQPAGTHCCTNTAPHFTQVAAPLQSLSSAQIILLTNKFHSFCFLSHNFSFQSASKNAWKNYILFAISLCCCWN